MKRFITIMMSVFAISLSSMAQIQTNQDSTTFSQRDSVFLRYLDTFRLQLREPCFELYQTENIWIFLELNTATGQIWMVQYSVNNPESPRMVLPLDIDNRVYYQEDIICGRFKLYPTKNMYNFILLDTIDGRSWQVQWNVDENKRGVWRIY